MMSMHRSFLFRVDVLCVEWKMEGPTRKSCVGRVNMSCSRFGDNAAEAAERMCVLPGVLGDTQAHVCCWSSAEVGRHCCFCLCKSLPSRRVVPARLFYKSRPAMGVPNAGEG